MKAILAVLALVVVLAACHENNMQSTNLETDSTTAVVDSISYVDSIDLVDSIK